MAENFKNAWEAKLPPDKHLLSKPQVNLGCSGIARMWLVSLCAFLAIMQSALTDSFSSLFLALSSVLAAVLTELLFSQNEKFSRLKDGSSVATALIITLFLPNYIPPIYGAMGTVFAIAVVKHSFGGIGSNWLNPAAGGWLFVRCAWPGVWNSAIEGAELSVLGQSLEGGIYTQIRSFLNETIFSVTGSELPGGYLDLLASTQPGIIADRGIFALLAGTVIITASSVNRSWIPAVWLTVYAFMVRLTGALSYGGEWPGGDLLFSLFSGGVIASAFILNADPATSAKSNWGIFAAAVLSGILAWFFRYYCGEPYGAVYAIAAINAALPVLRSFERRLLYEKSESFDWGKIFKRSRP
ncbi:MAG: RnfABCDGE type electron transport complex subunit D [Treponema sp.]|jgi:electron transport complex protein RnfD|nr:RnfABCDGE type electron transport complex subunit D [Treponema sp.]